jgi:hypothetical protein
MGVSHVFSSHHSRHELIYYSETNQAGVFQGFQRILDTLSGEEKRALLASLTGEDA